MNCIGVGIAVPVSADGLQIVRLHQQRTTYIFLYGSHGWTAYMTCIRACKDAGRIRLSKRLVSAIVMTLHHISAAQHLKPDLKYCLLDASRQQPDLHSNLTCTAHLPITAAAASAYRALPISYTKRREHSLLNTLRSLLRKIN